MKEHSLKKQSTYLFVGSFTAYLIHFLTTLVLVRVLSTNDFGIYQKFLLLSQTILAISGCGIATSLYYYYPTANDNSKSIYVLQSILLISIIGSISSLLLYLFRGIAISYFNMEEILPFIYLVMCFVFINLFVSLIHVLFVVEKKIWYNLLFHPIEKLLQLSILITFILIRNNYTYAIWGLCTYNALKFCFIVYYLKKNYKLQKKGNFSFTRIKNQLKYSLPLWYGIVLFTITTKIDKFLVNKYIDTEQFAIYTVALLSIPFLSQINASLNQVAMPKISTLIKQNYFKDVVIFWRKIVLKQLSVTLPAIVFFIIYAKEFIVIVFTERYVNATLYYQLYLITFLFLSTSYGLVIRGSNNTKKSFKANVISMIITIIFGIIVIPKYLLLGAVMTAIIGLISPICIQIYYELVIIKSKFVEWFPIRDFIKILFISMFSILIVFPLKMYISNIYLLFGLSITIYSLIVIILEQYFSLFIYPDVPKKINQIYQNMKN